MNAPFRPPMTVTLKLGAPLEPEPSTELKEIKNKDHSGRTISTFTGSPGMWLRQFACHPKRITQIRTRS